MEIIDPPSFELPDDLLGCRTDDPRLAELHRNHDLGPPPAFPGRDGWDGVGFDEWSLAYQATVRVPGFHPSIRVRGRGAVLGHLTKVYIQDGYTRPVRGGLSTALPEPEARTLALESRVEEYGNIVHVLHRDERSTFEVRYFADGRFIWYLLTLNERAEDDPELLRATERATAPRVIPPSAEPVADEAFPAALRALNAHQDASGFGEIGFEVLDRFESGGLTAWTGNAAAEREFRVFGMDGSGGLVAFWLVHDGRPVEQQPVVLLESEGHVGPVATDLCDLIHLLAAGFGPYEAVMYGASDEDADPQPAIAQIAETHLGRREGRTPDAILTDVENEYADIRDRVDTLSRQ